MIKTTANTIMRIIAGTGTEKIWPAPSLLNHLGRVVTGKPFDIIADKPYKERSR